MRRYLTRLRRTAAWRRLFPAPKYFVASPQKTATTTVGAALMTLGAGQKELAFRRDLLKQHRKAISRINTSIPPDIPAQDWIRTNRRRVRQELAPLIPWLAEYDVFSDAPFGHGHIHPFVLKTLAPKARFIWVDRPFKDWVKSVEKWEIGHPETYPRHTDWQTDPKSCRRRLRRRRARAYRGFTRLAEAFPGTCLELDIDALSGWDALAHFCKRPVPQLPPAAHNVSRKTPG